MEEKNYFKELNAVNVSGHIEKKNNLSYLSWAWAWGELKKLYPNAQYKVYENEQGWNYFTDGRTAWVKTGVIVNDIEHIEYLPIMDNRNKSIPLENITSFEVNKAIQRSLTKAVARHGLGLYIYAGEDLPEDTTEPQEKVKILDDKLIARCNELHIPLEAIAVLFKISFNELTNKHLETAIDAKERKLAKQNGTPVSANVPNVEREK